MGKVYQPFILEKADLILEILKDDIKCTEKEKNRLCDILTDKYIKGELDAEDPVHSIFNREELMSFIEESLIHEDLDHLAELGLIDSIDDENNEELYFITEKGKKYVEELKKEK